MTIDLGGMTDLNALQTISKGRDNSVRRHRRTSAMLRDIGEIAPPKNGKLRRSCQFNFQLFCESYFPEIFYLGWSDDQLRCIDKIQTVVLDGGLFALAMPRGSGKTALCQTAVLWAQAYGHRRYIYFIGDDSEGAEDSLQSIKTEWEGNPRLAEDFPEVCRPMAAAEGINTRYNGQTCYGKPVRCLWKTDRITLPSIRFPERTKEWSRWLNEVGDGTYTSINAGIHTRTKGITGGIRGAIHKHGTTGELLRPDLFVADDIQTDQVADSPSQIAKITRYLESAVQGLAGPGEVISGLMPCTVIQQGDVSDTFLDRTVKPQWKGERCAMVTKWPEGISDLEITEETAAGQHWNEYSRLRLTSLQEHGDIELATKYYQLHQETMDAGFEVTWRERYNKDPRLGPNIEISAQQHAMNLRMDNPRTFASEYQNAPLDEYMGATDIMTPEQIARRTSSIKRGEVPQWCEIITSFIDLQDEVMFYTTVASATDYTSQIIDYGTYPDFSLDYFTKAQTESWSALSRLYYDAHPEEKRSHTGKRLRAPFEGKIHFGLNNLVNMLLAKRYHRDDGIEMPIRRMGIDGNWGKTTDLVRRFCRYHGDTRLVPMHGRYIGATSKPFDEWGRRDGWLFEDQVHAGVEKVSWVMPATNYGIRHILVDTNFYKSFLFNRLSTSVGSPGCLLLFDATPQQHEMFAQHLGNSERPVSVQAKGKIIDEWKELPTRFDNDYLDCMVGALCLASVEGACLRSVGNTVYIPRNQKKRRLSDVWRKKRAM